MEPEVFFAILLSSVGIIVWILKAVEQRHMRDKFKELLNESYSKYGLHKLENLIREGWRPKKGLEKAYYLMGLGKWETLAKMGSVALDPLILATYSEDKKKQSNAIKALGELGDARAIGRLMDFVSLGDYDLRKESTESLVKIGSPAVAPLIDRLRYEGHEAHVWELVRERAAWALGEIGDIRATESLIETLRDKYVDVVNESVRALGKIGWKPQNDIDKLSYLLLKKEFESIDFSDISTVELIINAFEDKGTWIRERAAEAIMNYWKPNIKHEWAVDRLIHVLQNNTTSIRVKEAALWALGEIRSNKPVSALITCIENHEGDRVVGLAAAEALGKIKDEKAIWYLVSKIDAYRKRYSEEGPFEITGNYYPIIDIIIKIGEPAVEPLNHFLRDTNNTKKWLYAEKALRIITGLEERPYFLLF